MASPGSSGRQRPLPWQGVVLLATAIAIAGCRAAAMEPEPARWARAQLIATYTPLPPPTATMTPLPSATPTAPYATPTPDTFQAAGLPVRLEIPAIKVDTNIEHVGRLPDGHMDVPHLSEDVAWFNESALPGQSGKPAVINGHLDSPYGPAVFYDVRKLVTGDELVVTYENGQRFVFEVDGKERYAFDNPPSQKIMGANPRRLMNLITCDGAWDRGQANYQQRLVIYTRLKDGQIAGP